MNYFYDRHKYNYHMTQQNQSFTDNYKKRMTDLCDLVPLFF